MIYIDVYLTDTTYKSTEKFVKLLFVVMEKKFFPVGSYSPEYDKSQRQNA